MLNSNGTAVANGNYKMQFSIFDLATGGTSLWSETNNSVSVTNGLFSVILGNTTPMREVFTKYPNLWLDVTIDMNRNGTLEANEVYAPRQPLTGTAWQSHRILPNSECPNVIGGHSYNSVRSAQGATIGGGKSNVAGDYAFVGGGYMNVASGTFATVAGGSHNTASGILSMAAGAEASATHQNSFVWSDGNSAGSTRECQFFVRAQNGMVVGISPLTYEAQLQVTCNGNLNKPHLYLWEQERNDYVRLRMANSGAETKHWDLASKEGMFNIYYQTNILALTPEDSTNLMMMKNNARLSAGGAWINASDRAAKANFAAVNGLEILERVVAMPISTWNYNSESEGVRHMGPTAQDFSAAFGLGSDDKTICTLDAEGVALAAIQGLHQVVSEQSAQIAQLKSQKEEQAGQIAALQQQNAQLQIRLAALEAAVLNTH